MFTIDESRINTNSVIVIIEEVLYDTPMANILLTQQCVRSCPYCFAKKYMSEAELNEMISWEDFIYIIDLLEQDHQMHVSLLGGEPTLHPGFVDFVLYLMARNFTTTIFTCGIMSSQRLEEAATSLKALEQPRYSFVLNLNHPDMSAPKETEQIESFLQEFGERTTLSFNIFHLDFTMEYLFDYIERFDLHRHIRLGLAHPIPGENNLHIPREQFREMAERLTSYIPQFIKHNVSVGFDCGFPLCVFSDEELGKLYKLIKGDGGGRVIQFVCNPALDIGPDMSVWSCFPLSKYHKRSIFEFDSIREIIEYYKEFHRETRKKKAGLYDDCAYCRYRENELCAGGCLAHILNEVNQ